MYCPSCGAESNEALRYCKRCGANLNSPTESGAHGRFPSWLIVFFLLVMVIITIVGLTVPLAASHDLVADGFNPGGVAMIFVMSALISLGLDGLIVWLLLRLIKMYHRDDAPIANRSARQPVMKDYSPAQIAAPPEAIGSVTEHTTRNFDEYEKLIRAQQSNRDTQ